MPLNLLERVISQLIKERNNLVSLSLHSNNSEAIGSIFKWFFNNYSRPSPRLWKVFIKYIYSIPNDNEEYQELKANVNALNEFWLCQYKTPKQKELVRKQIFDFKENIETN